jgi:hypothetical protein
VRRVYFYLFAVERTAKTTKRSFVSIQRKEIREKLCGLCTSSEAGGEKLKGVSEKWLQNE